MYNVFHLLIRCLGDQFGLINAISINDTKFYTISLLVFNNDPYMLFLSRATDNTRSSHSSTASPAPNLPTVLRHIAGWATWPTPRIWVAPSAPSRSISWLVPLPPFQPIRGQACVADLPQRPPRLLRPARWRPWRPQRGLPRALEHLSRTITLWAVLLLLTRVYYAYKVLIVKVLNSHFVISQNDFIIVIFYVFQRPG